MKARSRILLCLLICLAWAGGRAAEFECAVSYVSAESIYLDAGLGIGLAVGDTLAVLRGGEVVARICVLHAATHSASCRVIDSARQPRPGDRVVGSWRPERGLEQERTGIPARRARSLPAARAASSRRSSAGGSGSVSVSWTGFRDARGEHDYDQPELRAGWRARDFWGGGWSFACRGRLRGALRDSQPAPDIAAEEWRTRVSLLALEYGGDGRRTRMSIGRVFLAGLPGAGAIDGLRLGRRLGGAGEVGFFAGGRPDWGRDSSVPDGLKLGAYWARGGSAAAPGLALAGVAERRGGQTSRDYLAIASRFEPIRNLRVRQSGEIDLNRGWRRDTGAAALALSNLQIDVGYPLGRRLELGARYDGRQAYRSYANRSRQDSLFDDALRQGLRGRVVLRVREKTILRASVGLRGGAGDDGAAWSYGCGATGGDLLRRGIDFGMNLAGFTNARAKGLSPSLRLAWRPRPGGDAAVSYGIYSFIPSNLEWRRNQWLRLDLGLALPGRSRIAGQLEHGWGDDAAGQRFRLDLGRRF